MDDMQDADYARELLRRQRARISLVEFSQAIDIPGVAVTDDFEVFKPIESRVAQHHILMMHKIQQCIEAKRGRLMIFAPPGAAKSTYASVVAPAWVMGRFPGTPIILASYASDIAEKQSRKVRAIVRDPRYSSIWADRPVLTTDQRAVDDWRLTNGSSMMAAGLLGGITGNRAGLLVIDDPVQNAEAAESATTQQKMFDEYISTAMTRALPHMSKLLIMTRWAEGDMAGMILPEDYDGESGAVLCQDGEVWEVLNLQARCERKDDPLGREIGAYLWPEFFPVEHWQAFENNPTPRAKRVWSSLYQQRPSPLTGIHFSRDMFQWYDPDKPRGAEGALPATDAPRRYGASDYATMADAKHDFTEHGVCELDEQGNLYLIDWWYEQCETDRGIKAFIAKVRMHAPLMWANEGGPIDKAIAPAINRAMRESQVFVSIRPIASIEAKDVKLMGFHARASAKTVFLPLKRAWAERLVDQLVKFPSARHDDAPDVCGLMGRLIDRMQETMSPYVAKREPALVPFSSAWLEYGSKEDKPKVRFTSRER